MSVTKTKCENCGIYFESDSERVVCDNCYAKLAEASEIITWRDTPLGKAIKEKLTESVDHPTHYTDGKIEVIDFIEDKGFNYHLGNVVKYISRAGKKDPDKLLEDLRKARWYLDRYIELLEKSDV